MESLRRNLRLNVLNKAKYTPKYEENRLMFSRVYKPNEVTLGRIQ